jgi:serine/threonine-protein phosphatase 2A regulatory subunit B'
VLIPLHKVKELTMFHAQLQSCVKNYLEKMQLLSVDLIKGLLKFWPLTCPAKEVIYINEIEEVMETMGSQGEAKFAEYGAALLKRLIQTSQSMHYQAAEKSLLFLNSDILQKLVKANQQKCYPTVVKGLLVSQ